MQLSNILNKILLIGFKRSLDLCRHKLLDLLWRTTNKGARIQERVKLADDGRKEFGAADTLNEVVGFSLFFDVVGCLVR